MVKPRVTILSTYPVFPRKHGGQLRIFNLYKNMTNLFEITIVSFNNELNCYEKREDDLLEISIPKSKLHQIKEWEIEKNIGLPVTDIVMEQLSHLTPEYLNCANHWIKKSDIIIACQPYLFHLMEKYSGVKNLIYDSQNVEYQLKQSMLPKTALAQQLLKNVFEMEKRACQISDLLITCSIEDTQNLKKLYQLNEDKIVLAPNGVDTELISYTSFDDRQKRKKSLGIEGKINVVFIGSWHKPNLEAVQEIMKLAQQLKEVNFIIMGGQCLAFKDYKSPKNVYLAGVVEEKDKQLIYSYADIALNPMKTGSGTNLKIAEYMASGIPVITTPVGSRGYHLENKKHAIICGLEEFPNQIKLLSKNVEIQKTLSENGRTYMEECFSWKNISRNYLDELGKKLNLEIQREHKTISDILLLIIQKDNHEFIFALYRELLNREPDEEGFQYMLNQLLIGKPKISVIMQVLKSKEATDLYSQLINGPSHNSHSPFCERLLNILTHDNENFVKSVFQEILNRRVKANELGYYMSLLNKNQSKLVIIKNVVFSKELTNLLTVYEKTK